MALSERSRTDLNEAAALHTFICVLRTLENLLDQISRVSLTHPLFKEMCVCMRVYGF